MLLQEINTKQNNITLPVSYHPLNERRSLKEFVEDFKQIPKGLNPTMHIIDVPEVSVKDMQSAFTRDGIYTFRADAHTPTEHNKLTPPFRKAWCKSDMDCISPELKVFKCLGLMLRNIEGVPIEDHAPTNEPQLCDYWGLCGPCTMQAEIWDANRS